MDARTLEQARLELSGRPLRATSASRSWHGISLDQFDGYDVSEMKVTPRDHHVISIALSGSREVLQERCGKLHESDCLPGEVTMIPAGYKGRWHGYFPAHLRIAVATEAVAECATELSAAGTPLAELRNGFRVRDSLLQNYGQIFLSELDRMGHPAQELIMSSVATAFCVHVVRWYTGALGVESRPTGSAGNSAIRRVIAYMRETDDRRPSLAELAAIAGISRFHFSRMFTRAIGLPPTHYLELTRIERAKEMIRSNELPLAEIALAVGFADQSHFTRRFRHWAGCTPAAYARDYGRRTHGTS